MEIEMRFLRDGVIDLVSMTPSPNHVRLQVKAGGQLATIDLTANEAHCVANALKDSWWVATLDAGGSPHVVAAA